VTRANEAVITRMVANFLTSHGWQIIALGLPRGGHGALLGSTSCLSGPGGRLRGRAVIDIVAVRGEDVLLVESKVVVSMEDVKKLLRARSGELGHIPAQLRLPPARWRVLIGVAVREDKFTGRAAEHARQVCDAVFLVSRDGRCVNPTWISLEG
jgi:Holliday junction resolvase